MVILLFSSSYAFAKKQSSPNAIHTLKQHHLPYPKYHIIISCRRKCSTIAKDRDHEKKTQSHDKTYLITVAMGLATWQAREQCREFDMGHRDSLHGSGSSKPGIRHTVRCNSKYTNSPPVLPYEGRRDLFNVLLKKRNKMMLGVYD
ncbi:hypothetical protein CBL_09420 [Carabus blaptoides fortunei]